jgi:hypothetical protein
MTEPPPLWDFEQVCAHVSAIWGTDRDDVARRLQEHLAAGRLHAWGRTSPDFAYVRNCPFQHIEGLTEIPLLAWGYYKLVYEIMLSWPDTGSSASGRCVAYRKSDDVRPTYGWAVIRFPKEEIRQLFPDKPLPEEAESEEPAREAGRPGKMAPVMAEFRRRKAAGTLKGTINADAKSLRTWAEKNCDDPPALQTIKNNIGLEFPPKPKVQKNRI